MSRKSRTPYAILGALSHGPKSGYDISRLFEARHLFFWNESYGQIYPTLKRLLDEGMVDMESEARDSGPERKIYSITQSGEEHLQSWLEDRGLKSSVRDEFMLKLYFTPETDKERTIEYLEALSTELDTTLTALQAENEALEQKDETFHRELAMSWSRHYHEARQAWVQESLEALGKKKKKDKKKKKKKKKKNKE